MARLRGFPVRTPTSRRAVSWGVGPQAPAQSLTATGQALWTSGITLLGDQKATIVRIRGQIEMYLTVASAVGDGFRGAFGLALVTAQAFAAGAGSIPGPVSESQFDGWMWHQFFSLHTQVATLGNPDVVHVQIPIDTKAMRKWVADDQLLVGMVEVVEIGTASLTFHVDSRVLVKLS